MENILKFLLQIGKLKTLRRTGWVLRDVKNPETVAGHSFRLAILAWIFGKKKKFNLEKLIKMALIHDIVEILAGDVTPYDHLILKNPARRKEILKKWPRSTIEEAEMLSQTKLAKEKTALYILTARLADDLKTEIRNLWLEYEDNHSKEGRFLRQAGNVENLLQAVEYAQESKDFPIESWWYQMAESIDDPELLALTDEIGKMHIQSKKGSSTAH